MAKDLIIYGPSGDGKSVESLQFTTHCESAIQQIDGQNADVVTVTIRSTLPIDYAIGSYLNVYGRRYWLNKKGSIRKASESDFTCTFKFEGVQNQLARSSYDLNLDPTHTGADLRIDSLTANLRRFVEILILSSQEATPGLFSMGNVPQDTEEKTISFTDEDSCLSALQRLCQEYETFFTFTPLEDGVSYAINIGMDGVRFPYAFRYGAGRGIYSLERQNVDDGNIINRLKVVGGSTNIVPAKYRNTELLLPGKQRAESFVDDAASIAKYGMWVGKKTFEDIYPHRTGVVSAAGDNYYSFVDSDMDFDINATDAQGNSLYLLAGETAKIHFNTGQLAGYEFDMVSYDHRTRTFVLKPYDTEAGYHLPNPTNAAFQIAAGDKYVILNIFMPEAYITKAENELLEAANKYLAQEATPAVKYSLALSQFFLQNVMDYNPDQNVFWIGDLIHIADEDLAIDADIKITGIRRDLLNPYDYTLTIADQITTTTVATQIVNDLKTIDRTLVMNNLFNPARARRNWKDQQELLSMVFDADGYFTDKIRPLSVETSMLAVGAKSMQFGLIDVLFEPNYGADPNHLHIAANGALVHYAIVEDSIRLWNMAAFDGTLDNSTPYFLYARCEQNSETGTWAVEVTPRNVSEGLYYYFLVGVLNTVDNETNTRSLSLTYGASTINGRFIKTGRILSADGATYFDLDKGEIGGRIVFTQNGQQKTLTQLAQVADSKCKLFYETPTPPYSSGDLWTNGSFLKRAMTSRTATENFRETDWQEATDYDNTKTSIDGGVVTSGTVQLAAADGMVCAGITGEGSDAESVRIWAGSTMNNRANAPFRVLNSGKVIASDLHISGTSEFEGKLKAVEGSFKKLQCVDENGNVVANLKFGSDGKLWIEDGDMYHQGTKDGRPLRLYSSDIWCRDAFGARKRTVAKIVDNRIYYYNKGISQSPFSIQLRQYTAANGERYYSVPMYTSDDTDNGMPIDVLVFCNSNNTSYDYALQMQDTQRALVINANKTYGGVNIYSSGTTTEWKAGYMAEVCKVDMFLTPATAPTTVGSGLMIGAFSRNTW